MFNQAISGASSCGRGSCFACGSSPSSPSSSCAPSSCPCPSSYAPCLGFPSCAFSPFPHYAIFLHVSSSFLSFVLIWILRNLSRYRWKISFLISYPSIFSASLSVPSLPPAIFIFGVLSIFISPSLFLFLSRAIFPSLFDSCRLLSLSGSPYDHPCLSSGVGFSFSSACRLIFSWFPDISVPSFCRSVR